MTVWERITGDYTSRTGKPVTESVGLPAFRQGVRPLNVDRNSTVAKLQVSLTSIFIPQIAPPHVTLETVTGALPFQLGTPTGKALKGTVNYGD